MRKYLAKIISKVHVNYKKFLGHEYKKWCLALISKKNFQLISVFYPPKNEFWADPFFFKHKNKDYCFFERFFYNENKGVIACAEIKNNQLINIKTILKKKYHLSFPFIFKEKKTFYLIPETYQKKRLEIYRCKKFPDKWELFSVHMKNDILADPVIFKQNKNLWLLINKTQNNLNYLNKYLYIYKIVNFKKFKILPHKKNPVIANFNRARNAAGFYNKNKNIRLSQINNSEYGEGLNLFKIKKINLNVFREQKVFSIKASDFKDKNIIGIHSLNSYKKFYLVDICYKFFKN